MEVDPTTKESETRMPISASIICSSGGCAHHVYNSSRLAGHTKRLPNTKLSKR